MSKKILSLDLGITSIGYSILEEFENDRYSLIDYGVSMFDKPTDKDGKSKKLLHSASVSAKKLYTLRKKRKINLSQLFENFKLSTKNALLNQEKENIYINKWELRAKKVFEEKLEIGELFTILYALAKHRGYKSLDSDDLLEELCMKLEIEVDKKKNLKEDDEKGQIKKALQTIENLKTQYPDKTIAQIIYEVEIQKTNPVFRNHDNYNYMIRREYINDEIRKIILAQNKFGLFNLNFEVEEFIEKLIQTIDDQKDSTNDMNLFGNCEYYIEEKVAHQYSLLSDIFKMYQSVSNITFNTKPTINITPQQIKLVADDFFTKIKKGKNITDIKYKDIRKILKLNDEIRIFNKEDSHLSKGKKQENKIIKFHFVNSLSKINNSFILSAFEKENKYEILKEIFDVLAYEKAPHAIYEKLKDKVDDKETIISLIKEKDGNSLNISHHAMMKFIPYFKEGLTIDDIKKKLNLDRKEDYSEFKKGVKYLHTNTFENDDNLEINNHPVKYVVSATLRLIKHLHTTYGAFDEIRVESTRELSQNEQTKKDIEKANRALEKQIDEIVLNKEYQKIADSYGKNLKKYARKILMWEEQKRLDIYTGKNIGFEDIFTNSVDLDHIVPQSLGGLSVKHNFVLVHRDTNLQKSNQLPINFIKDKKAFVNRVEYLFSEHKINWKKKINLLATNLDDTFKDTFESKSLRATSYIEALTAKILKRYYPFPNEKKQNDGSAVRHIQGRATSNIRKLLQVKTKVRDTNIHHAIDAILIGLTNQSWLQKLSNTFRDNMGVIDDEARAKIKKEIPLIEGIEPKELIEMIEDKYNEFGEDSIFYKDIFSNVKAVNFWVSKKPMVSKIHKDTIYAKKSNGIFTVREGLINKFIDLKTTNTTSSDKFMENFEKNILKKMFTYKTNPKDVICKIVQKRAEKIVTLLDSFVDLDKKNKESMSEAKAKLDELIHSDIIDNNGNVIRKVKFYQTNLTGFEIRGGLATKEKTFIGFRATLEKSKLKYERIDVTNFDKIQKEDNNNFKVFKNDLVFFVYPDGSFRGGKIVSFLDDKGIASFSNSRYPSASEFQPESFCKMDKGKKSGSKQQSVNASIGIIKLNLDIIGNIKSYQVIGDARSELLEFIKEVIK
ncbi:MAG: type II CRISPR RNA-guided endonuclease Cas9 [Campylobacterota bacterium]|nr:type II CRISPR RNA-guided endonuclease Cas9 [Campylobacterota bacterium]